MTSTPTITFSPTRTPERVCNPRPFPNPSTGEPIRFRCGGGPYERIDVRVFSPSFRKISSRPHACTGAIEEEDSWDLRDDRGQECSNGLYFLEIDTQQNGLRSKYVRKVLICR